MAGVGYHYVREITIGNSGGWKTAIQLQAATNVRNFIARVGAVPASVNNASPRVRLRLIRQTDAGSGGVTGEVPQKITPGGSEVSVSTLIVGPWATTEPTIGASEKASWQLGTHPQMPMESSRLTRHQWWMLGAERWALQYWNNSGENNLVTDFFMEWEE